MRFSSVTSPVTPPYSSTTTATCVFLRRNSLSSEEAPFVSGTKYAGRRIFFRERSGSPRRATRRSLA